MGGQSNGGYFFDLDVAIKGKRLTGSCRTTKPEESLALVYPLEGITGTRAAYTLKACGMEAEGQFKWGEQEIEFGRESFAATDWTKSFARRVTQWHWACFAGGCEKKGGGKHTVGLNASTQVYGDKENVIWIDGKVFVLGDVRFALPQKARMLEENWGVEGRFLKLEFHPLVERKDNVNLLILRNDFVQVCGTFHGTVTHPEGGEEFLVDGVLGVMEKHRSVW